jgi:hypothetical protein
MKLLFCIDRQRKFWHQMLRWPFQSTASFIARDVLGLPRPSLLERYTNILIVFTLSGFVHVCHDFGLGKPSSKYMGTMMFFQLFAVGIMIEDGVQELWCRVSGRKNDDEVPSWQKVVGFIWTAAFFIAVAPLYNYNQIRLPRNSNILFDFNLTDRFGLQPVIAAVVVGALISKTIFKGEI